MEVDQGEGEFPSNYYYDYEFNLEQERRKAIEAKIAAEEEQKKTLKYKFNLPLVQAGEGAVVVSSDRIHRRQIGGADSQQSWSITTKPMARMQQEP